MDLSITLSWIEASRRTQWPFFKIVISHYFSWDFRGFMHYFVMGSRRLAVNPMTLFCFSLLFLGFSWIHPLLCHGFTPHGGPNDLFLVMLIFFLGFQWIIHYFFMDSRLVADSMTLFLFFTDCSLLFLRFSWMHPLLSPPNSPSAR